VPGLSEGPSDGLEETANTWVAVAKQLRDDQESLASIADVSANRGPLMADSFRNTHNVTNAFAFLQSNAVHLADQMGAHANALRMEERR